VARIEQAFSPPGGIDAITGRVLPLGPHQPGLYPVSSRTSTVRVEFDHRAMPWEVGSGNNFAVKREWLIRIGGNDERLGPGSPGLGGVDMDLFYRLLRAGARIRYEPELLVQHARTTKEGRLSRRAPYGHGIGTGCLLWLRQGDFNALRVLARWFFMRLRRLASGPWHGQWLQAYEEVLVLKGTLRGLVHGFSLSSETHYAPTENH
jgi:GT2 family glycosyltransferase